MKLEIGNFPVKEITFGPKTSYAGGLLTINKDEAIAKVKEDEHITDADLHIVNPGDMVRLVPVKDAIEMRCRIEGCKGLYPGVTSPIERQPGAKSTPSKARPCWLSASTGAVSRMA